MSARAMLMSPQRTSVAPLLVQRSHPVDEALQEAELRAVVLAAVRHVDRRQHEVVERHLHDARLDVEFGMRELRRLQELAPQVQRHAGVPAGAVPERVVVGELAAVGHLVGPRLDLLQAHDVRPVALQPVAELRLAGANAVDVPGGDLHADAVHTLSRPRHVTQGRMPMSDPRQTRNARRRGPLCADQSQFSAPPV